MNFSIVFYLALASTLLPWNAHAENYSGKQNLRNTHVTIDDLISFATKGLNTNAQVDFDDPTDSGLTQANHLLLDQIISERRSRYILIICLCLALLTIAYLIHRTRKIRLRIPNHQPFLQENEEKYHQIFDYSIDAIITTDQNGIVTNMNKSAESMLGYTSAELIGKHVKLIYAVDEEYQIILQELLENDSFSGELVNKTKDGKYIVTRLSANQVRDAKGEVIGTMGISRDITDEVALQKEYNTLVNNVSDLIFLTDINGNFSYVNNTMTSSLGYSAKELIGASFHTIVHPEDVQSTREYYHVLFQSKTLSSYLEFRVIKKDGETAWVGQQVNAKINKFDEGKIDGYYGIVRIIDERKKSELKLQKSEEKYRNLIDNSSDLIQIVNEKGEFTYINAAWEKAMKYKHRELEGLTILDLVHSDNLEHCTTLFQSILANNLTTEERVLYSLQSKTGDKITVEGTLNTKVDGLGNVVAIESFLRDVTKQKEDARLLTQQESTLRQITETINDVFYLYNIVEQKYEYISPNCEVTLGANAQFFYDGRSHTAEYGFPDDVVKLNEAKEMVDNGAAYDIEFRILVNGEIRWINEKSFSIRDEAGNIVANSGICRDITDIREANETIRIQNHEIGSSILYAKRIQESVLPSTKEINNIFPDSFVIFKPKDVVSGDFYIVDHVNTNDHDTMPILIVGDCTGHGVPGAVLSLMCNVLVRETFTRPDVNSPAAALDYVRQKLTSFFSSNEENNIRDGMDISFCALNRQTNKLYFSGANSSCLIVRNHQIIEQKGDRQHVGFNDDPVPFTSHILPIEDGDMIFLASDGYVDQFGGKKVKKFGKSRFHDLILEASELPMSEVGVKLEQEYTEWRGDEVQIDDITILGVRI